MVQNTNHASCKTQIHGQIEKEACTHDTNTRRVHAIYTCTRRYVRVHSHTDTYT